MTKPIHRVLIGLILLVCLWGVHEARTGNKNLEILVTDGSKSLLTPSHLEQLDIIDIPQNRSEDIRNITQRPLFLPGRRAESNSKLISLKQEITPPRTHPNIVLNAIIMTSTQTYAIVKLNNSQSQKKVMLGDTVQGWRISNINNSSLTLSSGSRLQRIDLKGFK